MAHRYYADLCCSTVAAETVYNLRSAIHGDLSIFVASLYTHETSFQWTLDLATQLNLSNLNLIVIYFVSRIVLNLLLTIILTFNYSACCQCNGFSPGYDAIELWSRSPSVFITAPLAARAHGEDINICKSSLCKL